MGKNKKKQTPEGPPSHHLNEMEEGSDYTTGDVRRHHQFYIQSGDIVFQVEKAIFKIHSHFLMSQSDVFNDMFSAPKDNISTDGSDRNPLVLVGDAVEGWEQLLSSIYRSVPTAPIEYDGKEIIAMLCIAHKYCMVRIEEDLLSKLGKETGTPAFINLFLASEIIDSSLLNQQALNGLISSHPKPTLEEAQQIGLKAYHAVMSQSKPLCPHCQGGVTCSQSCSASLMHAMWKKSGGL